MKLTPKRIQAAISEAVVDILKTEGLQALPAKMFYQRLAARATTVASTKLFPNVPVNQHEAYWKNDLKIDLHELVKAVIATDEVKAIIEGRNENE